MDAEPATIGKVRSRMRWRWRILLLLLVSFCGLLIYNAIAIRIAERALISQWEGYRKHGDPVTLRDLQQPFVPDDENAIIDLQAASLELNKFDFEKLLFELRPVLPFTNKEAIQVDNMLKLATPAMTHLRRAVSKNRVDWRVNTNDPIIDLLLPRHAKARALSELAAHSALQSHLTGDDDNALKNVRVIQKLGAIVAQHLGLVSHLVSIGIYAKSTDILREIVAELKIGDSQNARNVATRAQLQELIGILLDDKSADDAMDKNYLAERLLVKYSSESATEFAINQINHPKITRNLIGVVFVFQQKPLALKDAKDWSIYATETLSAMHASDYPTAISQKSHAVDSLTRKNNGMFETIFKHSLAGGIFVNDLEKWISTIFRFRLEKRATAVLLALRLYAEDHAGQFPKTLDELVPQYLPTIPADPFALGAPSLRYIHSATDPVIYSVGCNGQDDGGSERAEKPTSSRHVDMMNRLDVVFHYRRPPRDLSDLPPELLD